MQKNRKKELKIAKIESFVKLKKTKQDESNWTIADIKIAIKACKVDSDGTMSSIKQELIDMWEKVKNRESDVLNQLMLLNASNEASNEEDKQKNKE